MIHRHAGVVAAMVLASGATAQDAVQWRVEDGGNGHWYVVEVAPSITWQSAVSSAAARGGYLATISSAAENQFILKLARATPGAFTSVDFGPFLGALQVAGADGQVQEPGGSWSWLSGEAWSFTNWLATEPNDFDCGPNAAPENYLQLYLNGTWNDSANDPVDCGSRLCVSAAVEWSADCNNDGIVDFGQLRDGELEDSNANNIPDCCESGENCDPCAADVVEDGVVNGVDLAAVINAWGTAGGKLPRTDVDGNGVVDASDLAAVLSSWGPCQP